MWILLIVIAIIVIVLISKKEEQTEKDIRKNSSQTRTLSAAEKENYKLIDFNDHFAFVLDNTLKHR